MALLMMDDEDDSRKHFNYKKIVEQQNLSKKKKKLLMKKNELLEDDFQVIVYSWFVTGAVPGIKWAVTSEAAHVLLSLKASLSWEKFT